MSINYNGIIAVHGQIYQISGIYGVDILKSLFGTNVPQNSWCLFLLHLQVVI